MSQELVDNVRLRRAIAAFGADANERTMLEVLRAALVGDLLIDATGTALEPVDGEVPAGSQVQVTTTIGADGGRVLLAFTNRAALDATQLGGERTALPQPGASVLEMAQRMGASLAIDPAEASVMLSPEDLDYALRHPRNDALSRAIAVAERGAGKAPLLAALREDGPLLLAGELAEGQTSSDESRLRMTTRPDGTVSLLAFTSAPEIAARNAGDGVIATTTAAVLERLAASTRFDSLVINPAGPWVEITRDELLLG